MICGLGVFFPEAASAEERAVEAAVSALREFYEALEYERALEQVQQARRLHLSVDEDISLYLYEGILLAELGRTEESITAFRASLALAARFSRAATKLPMRVSPKIEQTFEFARDTLHARAELARSQQPLLIPGATTGNVQAVPLRQERELSMGPPWFKRWYVWAGVGVVAVAVGAVVATQRGARPISPDEVCGGPCDGIINGGMTPGVRW